MLRDLGSRDAEFIGLVADIRRRLVALSGADEEHFTAVPMQGSGTFGIEAVISTAIPPEGKILILVNGAYGQRMVRIADRLRIAHTELECPEDCTPAPAAVEDILAADSSITHVAIVHCETTSGIINPVAEVCTLARLRGCCTIVDAMSSFAAYPISVAEWGIDFLVSSANKCIEGVPGFSFVIARKGALEACQGHARSLCLDLVAQWEGLEGDGQFRFTPPTHAMLAFHAALLELEAEGGVAGRAVRYQANYAATLAGMQQLGFAPMLRPEERSYIITSFYYPQHPNFVFRTFYEQLSRRGYVIYPGKMSQADCFRIGHIGRIDLADVFGLLTAMREVLSEMGIPIIPI
jgi:2-aminoethylphosphonate-pyruvate transaminase